MATQEPITPTTCDHCGKAFNTSAQHPNRYCSIACEEGRAPLADDDPRSPNYHLYLQGRPETLVGKNVMAAGLNRTDYSPDWHKSPDTYSRQRIVEHQESENILILKDDVHLGRVVDLTDGVYKIRQMNINTGKTFYISVNSSTVLSQIKNDRWWIHG